MKNFSLTQSLKHAALTMSLGLSLAVNAHAGLVGVKSIEISNGINQWLQVAEVAAFNMSSVNMALASQGATASAPDVWETASNPSKAIDGSTLGTHPNIFHEGSPFTHDTLTIMLASVQELASFQIWGRTDCCSSRDIYDVTFKGANGEVLFFIDNLDATGQAHTAMSALPNTVPEPSSLALLGLGLLAFAGLRSRKR